MPKAIAAVPAPGRPRPWLASDTVTSYTLRKASPDRVRTDVVVAGVGTDARGALVAAPGSEPIAEAYGRRFRPLLASLEFRGAPGAIVQIPAPEPLNAGRLLVVGLGEIAALTPDRVRRAGAVAARSLGNAASAAIALPAADTAQLSAAVEGFASGLYRFDAFKAASRDQVAEVVVLTNGARKAEFADALERATGLAAAIGRARDWVNTPANALVPRAFAEEIRGAVRGTGIRFELIDAEALAELGCGGILGVGSGSDNPPCLVKLSWAPRGARAKAAFVGKGITYDSGGLNIKPGSSMNSMKSDMAGAAAVVAAMVGVAERKLPVRITGYLPLAENMISGRAMRPGDVLTTLSGRTVEVLNTDAEGRLILADALTMAAREKPESIIDVATLTGHCVVALGDRIAGLFGDAETTAAIERAAGRSGELFWPLPIPPEQRASVREESKIADLLQHNWVRWGGALYAAAFLEVFTENLPWAHLDIAGPSFNSGGPWGSQPSGGTGFAVSTLVEYAEELSQSAAAS